MADPIPAKVADLMATGATSSWYARAANSRRRGRPDAASQLCPRSCGILVFAKLMQLADRAPGLSETVAFVIEAIRAATTSIDRGPGRMSASPVNERTIRRKERHAQACTHGIRRHLCPRCCQLICLVAGQGHPLGNAPRRHLRPQGNGHLVQCSEQGDAAIPHLGAAY